MIQEKNETYKFYKLTAEDGYVITEWKEGDDITTYASATLIYCPLTTDLSKYREITDTENEVLERQRDEEMEKRIETPEH